MDRYICVHGHFYQPPRENAWLEFVELQDSAYPYHDWNERITAECYATNATSRILNERGKVGRIVNNYSRISFDFGPTLLIWLEKNVPRVYRMILEADRESRERFSGHGSALAQPYNHMIMPLANRADKASQIVWGIKDFQYRFNRRPEGMWLPETAVDLETLDLMAEQDIRFTILAPHQASRIRPAGARGWHDVSGGRIDPTVPYFIRLPSGRKITLFFYDALISRAVAFEGLLNGGDVFAQRLIGGFSDDRSGPQLLHIATDGESYGHHHRNGDMALAYALSHIEFHETAKITNYGEHLERFPPKIEVEILENSSWSCVHGIERWRSDCGCNSRQYPGWNQSWRAPLRAAFDWLRDTLAPVTQRGLKKLLVDPREARDEYIRVILDRSPESLALFFDSHAVRPLNETEKSMVIKLMELNRHAMLMYTSCGWFFDEISGIETVQVIQYAGRALQLAREVYGEVVEPRFLELLEQAKSNIVDHRNGRRIYEKFVAPAMVDLKTVGAHYAMRSLFEGYRDPSQGPAQGPEMIHTFAVEQEAYRKQDVGRAKLTVGSVRVRSEIIRESERFCFGVIHWGDHNLSGCIRRCSGEGIPEEFTDEVFNTFTRAAFPETLSLLEKQLGPSSYSLRNLFRDEQRRILNIILDSPLRDAEGGYRQIYETHAPLLRFLKDTGVPAPRAVAAAAEYVLNSAIKQAFDQEKLDFESIRELMENAHLMAIPLEAATLEITIRRRIEKMTEGLLEDPFNLTRLEQLEAFMDLIGVFPFEVNLRRPQNAVYEILSTHYRDVRKNAGRDKKAEEWIRLFSSVCDKMSVQVPKI
jgi:alpha-amylase/alpha-mannosidase (GH57 family)